MPVISVDGPKVEDKNKKREFVEKVTRIAADFYNLPEKSIVIMLKENNPDNVSVGGKLTSDKG
jgi:4-oxalocrotonate tautomerase